MSAGAVRRVLAGVAVFAVALTVVAAPAQASTKFVLAEAYVYHSELGGETPAAYGIEATQYVYWSQVCPTQPVKEYTTQRYDLWATNPDGTYYLVKEWNEYGNNRYGSFPVSNIHRKPLDVTWTTPNYDCSSHVQIYEYR